MRRTIPAAAVLLLVAASAVADEYVVEAPPTSTLFQAVPKDPKSATVPNGYEVVLGKHRDGARPALQTIPFSFPFFGRNYGTLVVSEDGWLSFDVTSNLSAQNTLLPSTLGPNALVAALWDDLRTTNLEIVKFTTGNAPDRAFVIAWRNVVASRNSSNTGASFEVVLHETTGVIDIAYAADGRWNGLTYTAGIESETGTRAFGAPNLTSTNSGAPDNDYRFSPKVSRLTGSVAFERRLVTEAGLAGTVVQQPVAGATIEILREDDRQLVASGLTAADGTFDVPVRGLDASPTLAVELVASGAESKVVDGATGRGYRHSLEAHVVPDGDRAVGGFEVHESLDKDADKDVAVFRRALCIQQAAHAGYDFAVRAVVAAVGADPRKQQAFPQLTIKWAFGTTATSGYTPKAGTTDAFATINGAVTGVDADINVDSLDEFVVLREYAQHVLNTIATPPGALTNHFWAPPVTVPPTTVATPAATAFADGFSFWFAAAVKATPRFIDLTSETTSTVFDLEVPSPAASGANVAGAVAASLWDLCDDTPGETHDSFKGSVPDTAYAVLTTIDQKLGVDAIPADATAVTIGAFFEEWRAARTVTGEAGATAIEFIHHKTLPDDTYEPNDVAGAEKPLVGTGTVFSGLVLNASNEDRFAVTLAAGAVVSVSFPETSHIDLQLLGPAGEILREMQDSTSPAVVMLDDLAAGPYRVRVAWRSGPASNYTLSIGPAATIGKVALAWTAGVAYSDTLKATGAVPPVSFAWNDDVPGLTLDEATGSLSGTPTTPGSYVLHLVMTEAGGSGAATSDDRPFVVHPPLVLPPYFGIAPVDVGPFAVGHGGTNAVWSLPEGGGTALPTGFSLVPNEIDGATQQPVLNLHHTGAQAAPQAFVLSASARDDTGLRLTSATSQVVVCSPLASARGGSPGAAATFGYWFDAIEQSRATVEVAFSGKKPPEFRTLIDDAGATIPVPDGALTIRGGTTRLSGISLPRTSKYFVVFESPAGYSGRVTAARSRVRPPTRFSRVVDIVDDTTVGEIRFSALAGSTLRVVVSSGDAPVAAKPATSVGVRELSKPAETKHEGRFDRGHRRLTVGGIALAERAVYVVTFGGESGSRGPLVVELFITPPANTALSSGN